MKKINTFLILFSLILISCSDDDSSGTNDEVEIVGKWELTEFKVEGTFEGPGGNEEQQEISTTLEDCDPAPTWEFFSNGNLERREFEIDIDDGSCLVGDLVQIDTWERIDDNTIQINEGGDNQTIEFEVSFNGNNQAEVSNEQTDAGTVAKTTIFLTRL